MKKTLFTLTIGLFLVACGDIGTPTSQVAGATASHYGEMINSDGAISTADLTSKMESQTSMNVKFEGDIIQTCRKKGCWMSIDLGDQDDMTVTFKDYAFFVPVEGVDGKTMIAEGVCSWDTLDLDWLQHLAEDAGKSQEEIDKITEPELAMAFEATGVIIKDYADAAE